MLLVELSIFIASAWCLTPRLCRHFDRHSTLQHVTPLIAQLPTSNASQSQSAEISVNAAELFESLAMTIRSGTHSHQALESLADQSLLPAEFALFLAQHSSLPLHQVLTGFRDAASNNHRLHKIATLLLQSFRDGSLHPAALDIAATTLRASDQLIAHTHTASAQARITARLLTFIPFVVVGGGSALSSTFRSSLHNPAVVVLILMGVVLNAIGYYWMKIVISSAATHSLATGLEELLTSAAISLKAGASLTESLHQWSSINSTGHKIATSLSNGETLSTALVPLIDEYKGSGDTVRRLIIEAAHAGTPLIDLFARLMHDARAETSRKVSVALQQVSTKLTMPIVFCVLPAFLLLALMPVAIVSIGALPSHTVI